MPANLTFGVEIEFALATLPDIPGIQDPDPNDGRPVRNLHVIHPSDVGPDPDVNLYYPLSRLGPADVVRLNVAMKLREAGLRARPDIWPYSEEIGNWEHDRDLHYDRSAPESKWTVQDDGTINDISDSAYVYERVELSSPALWFCQESIDEIVRAIDVITSSFRVRCDQSCGLHIHVGPGGQRFSLDHMQKLFAFLWTFEEQISTLHSAERQRSPWTCPMRISSWLANTGRFDANPAQFLAPGAPNPSVGVGQGQESIEGNSEMHTVDALTAIFNTTELAVTKGSFEVNKENLVSIISPAEGNRLTYRTDLIARKDTKRTVEFRQHDGTFERERIVTWIETVVRIVSFTRDVSRPVLVDFLIEQAIKEDRGHAVMPILDMFRAIGLEKQAGFYAARLRNEDPQEASARRIAAHEHLLEVIQSQRRLELLKGIR
ncbi:MAG: hypothetical protein M1818_002188 [Claussenomyces sp. TS43310]|nr:MAG: hypothetical protein M1818_002188 [Claussenomyces sp. TS43310]